MCGYCIERNLVLDMWQRGEFSTAPGIEDIFCDSYSIECPDFSALLMLHQSGQLLWPVILLVRLAAHSLVKHLTDAEQQLQIAMLKDGEECHQKSDWPLLDELLSAIYTGQQLPFAAIADLPVEIEQQLLAVLHWAVPRFYPEELAWTATDDVDEALLQQYHQQHQALTDEFYLYLPQISLALEFVRHLQPQHPIWQQIALNPIACNITFNAYELAFKRYAQVHCIEQYGIDWFWQHWQTLPTVNIFYLAARLRFTPAEIIVLQLKLEKEHLGCDMQLSREECISALSDLSRAIEFSF
jgi:hypothetical protein